MSDMIHELQRLAIELEIFLITRPNTNEFTSIKYKAPGPIEDEWPELYQAVKDLEQHYGSILPTGGWGHWWELLSVCRKTGDDMRRAITIYVEANSLLDWTRLMIENEVSGITNEPNWT